MNIAGNPIVVRFGRLGDTVLLQPLLRKLCRRYPLVLLQPGNKRTMRWNGIRQAQDDDKSWPAERWIELACAINQRLPQAQVLLCGSAIENPYLNELSAACPRKLLPFKIAVLPLGRLKALLEIAHSMVSVDTGPAHLAAAMSCPLVVLFGNRSPLMWAPRGSNGSAVAVMGGIPIVQRVADISIEVVFNAWSDLVRSESEEGVLPVEAKCRLGADR